MFESIADLLAHISSLPARQLQQVHWNSIENYYRSLQPLAQEQLIKSLSPVMSLPAVLLQEIMEINSPSKRWEKFSQCQAHFDPAALDLLQERAYKTLPSLQEIPLKTLDWFQLEQNRKRCKAERLTPLFLSINLADITETKRDVFNDLLSKRNPKRACAPQPSTKIKANKRMRVMAYKELDIENNPCILNSNSSDPACHSPLKRIGTHIKDLKPISPKQGYSQVFSSPGGSWSRLLFSNDMGDICTPLTPVTKDTSGMVDVNQCSRKHIENVLPKLIWEQAQSAFFTATRKTIEENAGAMRRVGQNYFFKAPCRSVFAAHDASVDITAKDNAYNWSHVEPILNGGIHARRGLFAGTRASNMNTYKLVESYFVKKLVEERTYPIEKIDIRIGPHFNKESMIPNESVCELEWTEKNEEGIERKQKELLIINPRSHRPITRVMRHTIDTMRELSLSRSTEVLQEEEICPPVLFNSR